MVGSQGALTLAAAYESLLLVVRRTTTHYQADSSPFAGRLLLSCYVGVTFGGTGEPEKLYPVIA